MILSRIKLTVFVFLLSNISSAEEIWKLEVESDRVREVVKPTPQPKSKASKVKTQKVPQGNLTRDFIDRHFDQLASTNSAIVLPSDRSRDSLQGLNIGDTIKAKIEHSIIAFPDEKAPVVARIIGGSLDGFKMIGDTTFEKNSNRIFIDFKMIAKSSRSYRFKGSATDENDQTGFIGELHSQEAKYFAGDFLSSVVAAYFDGLVPRAVNPFGQIQSDTSIDSSFKKGLASGAMASAERFKEKLKKTPQFLELPGPVNIKVLVLEKAVSF